MPKLVTDGFTPEDDAEMQRLLRKWAKAGGGAFADATFTLLAYALPQPTIETVVLRRNTDGVEVLLIPRPQGDPIWNGMLHSPGQALRRMDYFRSDGIPVNGPFERVQKGELKCEFTSVPQFVGVAQYMTERGPEAMHCYLAQVPDDATLPSDAVWMDVKDLKDEPRFIQHQTVPVRMAEKFFEQQAAAKQSRLPYPP